MCCIIVTLDMAAPPISTAAQAAVLLRLRKIREYRKFTRPFPLATCSHPISCPRARPWVAEPVWPPAPRRPRGGPVGCAGKDRAAEKQHTGHGAAGQTDHSGAVSPKGLHGMCGAAPMYTERNRTARADLTPQSPTDGGASGTGTTADRTFQRAL